MARTSLVAWLVVAVSVCHARPKNEIADAQTVEYCDLLKNLQTFNNKIIRVRVLYQTDFEQSVITAPACSTPIPWTWVDFEKSWESRTGWRIRHAIKHTKWRVQRDVVLIGRFRAKGSFGHMGMYPSCLEVYKVEAVKPSGSFRPMPATRNRQHEPYSH